MSSDYLVYVLNDDGLTYTNKYLLDNFPSFDNGNFTYDELINQRWFKVEEDEFEFYQNKRKVETEKILNISSQMILCNSLFKVGVDMLFILSNDSEDTTLEERQMAARTIQELIGPYLEN